MRLLYLLFLPLTAFTYDWEKSVNVAINIDPTNFHQLSHTDVNTAFVRPFDKHLLIVNPRMSAYFNGKVDFSLGFGGRYSYQDHLLGAHLFYDFTFVDEKLINQIGMCYELIFNHTDHRINFYFPIKKETHTANGIYQSDKWCEFETVYKHDFFHFGWGPTYNISNNNAGAKLRITIPYHSTFLTVGAHYDTLNNLSSNISLGFKLFTFEDSRAARVAERSPRIRHYPNSRACSKAEFAFQRKKIQKKMDDDTLDELDKFFDGNTLSDVKGAALNVIRQKNDQTENHVYFFEKNPEKTIETQQNFHEKNLPKNETNH